MNRLKAIKNIVKKIIIVLISFLVIIVGGFIVHIIKVNEYNATERKITPESTTTDVMIDIHPRGQVTDKWEKDNAFPDKIIYARIYEATVNNNSDGIMTDWNIRININDDCFLNNAWCGKMEVHQFVEGEEKVQLIDLRDYEEKDIKIDHYMAGQDLLIPLSKGDYVIYRADDTGISGESPLGSSKTGSGQANTGFIFYSESGEVDFSDYSLNYFIHKSYTAGTEGLIFLTLFIIWLTVFAFAVVISVLVIHFEGRLFGRNRLVEEAFRICAVLSDVKDSYSKGHSKRVAEYARMIAEEMGMDKSDCENVYYVAMIHNIGNYYIPEQILRKGDNLSPEELEIVKSHTSKGAELLEYMESLPHVVEGALYHHEKYDGSGYPSGLKGDVIPLIARIIAVADAFDSMVMERPYRSGLTMNQIRQVFTEDEGKQFDPVIVGVFLSVMEKIEL